jgi:hypothetical protein
VQKNECQTWGSGTFFPKKKLLRFIFQGWTVRP